MRRSTSSKSFARLQLREQSARADRKAGQRIACTIALLALFVISSAGWIFGLDPTSQISQYGHRIWRVQDGYFGGMPTAVAQTSDGYIWVGTDAGLFKFDGVRFAPWVARSGEQLPSSPILALVGARDGSLWIGMGSGLAHLVDNRLILYEKNVGWLVAQILEDKDGKIWIERQRADDHTHPLCQVVNPEIRCYGSKDGVDMFDGTALIQDPSGDLWAGSNTTLIRWRPGAFPKVYRPRSLQSHEGVGGVEALAVRADGTLWVGMDHSGSGAGLQHMVDGALQPFLAPKLNGENLEVLALRSDHQNGLWVGTTQGVYRIRGTEVDHYTSADGLSGDFVYQIFEDREGDVWIATSHGIDMFWDLSVKSFSKHEGLIEDGVESVAASRNGTVWIGTSRLQVLGEHGISSEPGQELPGDQVTSIFEDHAGRLWAGMVHRLFVYDQGRFRKINKQNGSALGMVMGITEDTEHNIWVESSGPPATLFRIRDLQVRQEFAEPEMPPARKIVADLQSGIWLGLVQGDLTRYRDGKIDTFTFGDHPHARVIAITAGSDGSILGATDFGVIAWKNGKQQILTIRNGLPCNSVTALIFDNAGNLWLYSQCGLIEILEEQVQLWWEHPASQLKMRVFDSLDGMQPGLGHFNTSARTPDGRLWFANGNVLQEIDPAHIPANTLAPAVDISALVADRKPYPLESVTRLPELTRDLEIDYAALSYVAPQKVRFRYRLEGKDQEWQEPGSRRQAFYNDLRPGRYRFHVIACNNDGVWNDAGAFLNFSIAPAYYQTTWFRAACGAVFLLLLWGIYQLRVRQLHYQFDIGVEARVNERTRIARELHDTLLQSFQGLLLLLQSVSNLLPARPDDAKKRLDTAIDQASQAIAEGRDAVQGLRSSTLVAKDLALAMRVMGQELVAGVANQNSPVIDVVVEGVPQELRPIVRDEVYRISAEALRNAFRHAQASQIEIEIRYDAHEFRVRIRDDGKGIDTETVNGGVGHFGLSGMRERAKGIGANLEIWSSRDSGTEIQLILPTSVSYETPVTLRRFWFSWR